VGGVIGLRGCFGFEGRFKSKGFHCKGPIEFLSMWLCPVGGSGMVKLSAELFTARMPCMSAFSALSTLDEWDTDRGLWNIMMVTSGAQGLYCACAKAETAMRCVLAKCNAGLKPWSDSPGPGTCLKHSW
jgi:hypothetical protein